MREKAIDIKYKEGTINRKNESIKISGEVSSSNRSGSLFQGCHFLF
jgi:hypothetical protein